MKKKLLQFPGKQVLVAEDNVINQELTKDMLEILGCQVDVASNGEEALRKFKEKDYDLILMDIQMPKKDGFQVTREMRELELSKRRGPIIVALTANALSSDRDECILMGMDDYLSKPIEIDNIEDLLKKYFDYL